jgi:hypothetical protein
MLLPKVQSQVRPAATGDNSRNGTRPKTVLTETRPVQIEVLRVRAAVSHHRSCASGGGWTGSTKSLPVPPQADGLRDDILRARAKERGRASSRSRMSRCLPGF